MSMIRILKAMVTALWMSFLFALLLIIIGVPYLPMLIASEAVLVVLFSLGCWKPCVLGDVLHSRPDARSTDDPFALDKRLLGGPTYGELIENLMLAIGTWFLDLGRHFVAFMNREDDDLDSIRYGGQSNSALLTLIKSIESEIEARSESQSGSSEMQFGPADWQKE